MDPRGEIVGVDISGGTRVSALPGVAALCLHSVTHCGQDRVADGEVSVRVLGPPSTSGLDSPPPPLVETLNLGRTKSAPRGSDKAMPG
ncbi:hypothetical protein I79_025494 [Cricetulus griseus]|uniref:Uncharacterized protein n=1 Tax=Cricetulus griseus TaxID=10029 RepID=G3INH1_CRIGR|nr:hypothetical protein I79_025494 [Cricetulus griseus]ERE85916.1 hypothetical protein H671_2g4887 [Cricetulus griseus]